MPVRFIRCFFAAVTVLVLLPALAFADDTRKSEYLMDDVFNAGLDTGYNETKERTSEDPHFGWELGQFIVSGFSGIAEDPDGNPVFLKNDDDKVKLSFELFQNIDVLNGNENLSINNDTNGRDVHFGISETDFGRGMLVIRATDYRNKTTEPYKQLNYLSGIKQDRVTEIIPLQEGDYEVRLDYEIVRENHLAFVPTPADYFDYKIDFKFSVRNGNSMVYLFDLETGNELTNESFAPNGFRIDLAKSRHNKINLKKEIMTEGKDGLAEDTRFNGSVQDGKEYKEEGIYTITSLNPTTEQMTQKVIYVGDDPVMKVHVITGESIEYINERLANGDLIDEETWTLTAAPTIETADETTGETTDEAVDDTNPEASSASNTDTQDSLETPAPVEPTSPSQPSAPVGTIVLIVVIVIGVGVLLFFIFRGIKKTIINSSELTDEPTKEDAIKTVLPKTPAIKPDEETTIEVKIVDGEAVTIVDSGNTVTILDDGNVVDETKSPRNHKQD